MNGDRWANIERLYHLALDLPSASRDAFLETACDGDEDLRREVSSLLAHDDPDETTFARPAMDWAARALARTHDDLVDRTFVPGRVIGHYRLVRRIGQGGMGDVFLADDLTLERRVALKFLPADLANDDHARSSLMHEARAASALTHPHIVTVHSVDEAAGLTFIVMAYVEGETLADKLLHGPLPLHAVLDLGTQVAEALAAAHAIGLIHRDIKPANLIVTAEGQTHVLDFGIATHWHAAGGGEQVPRGVASTSTQTTSTGLIHGTASYMAPEQTRGEPIDPRADLFSLGAVLYEAATGARPFVGSDVAAIVRAIATSAPRPPSVVRPDLPPEFDDVIGRALEKDAANRFGSARDFAVALRALRGLDEAKSRRRWQRAMWVVATLLLVLAGTGVLQYVRSANRRWASESLQEAERLAGLRQYREAYDLVVRSRDYLPQDAAIDRLMPIVADTLTVESEPGGARVYLTTLGAAAEGASARQVVGTTPLVNLVIARDDYMLEIEKDGYAPLRRTIASALVRTDRAVFDATASPKRATFTESGTGEFRLSLDAPGPIAIRATLVEAARVPAGMVPVRGGSYRLVAADKPITADVQLDDYFIDQFEVSNGAYREFIAAGGYERREFWTEPVMQDGRPVDWPAAMALFRDRTGKPGPRSWSNQTYMAGLADHPVTDVTWYEAAAYATFRHARLPTIFQWEKAARDGQFSRAVGYAMPWGLLDPAERIAARANYLSGGTVPVDAFPFGISPYGVYQMAGNVAEWCLNARPVGRTVAGGSWQDPLYLFGNYGRYPALHASSTIGFRTVKSAGPVTGDQGAMSIDDASSAPVLTPVNDATYRTFLSHYHYDHTPLEAEVTARHDAADWIREHITYLGADGARASAYMYLPKRAARPLQVIHYVPSDAVLYGLSVADEVEALMTPLLREGRAVFAVVNQGFSERPFAVGYAPPDRASVRYRDLLVRRSIDLQRGLDYLATRPEIDMTRLAGFGTSIWSSELIPFAVERRYRAIVLLAAGLPQSESRALAEANAVNFLPRYGAPTLMLLGRHDESISYLASAQPAFNLLPSPKSLRLFDGGHMPPLAAWVPVATEWLDGKLGKPAP